jgi:membrane protein
VQELIFDGLARVVPQEAVKLVRETLADIVNHRSGSLASLGLIGALWSASSGVASLMDALNIAYDLEESRPFWKRRLKGIVLTLAMGLLVAGGSILVMIGHRLGRWLESVLSFSSFLAIVSTILGYVTGIALLFAGIGILYSFGPDVKEERKRVWPGAVFATGGIVVGSLLFSLYVRVGPSSSITYGSLGAVITLLLWLYLVGLMLLIGGEINSELA